MDELKRRAAALDVDVKALTDTTAANTDALDRVNDRLDKGDRDKKWVIAALLTLFLIIGAVAFIATRTESAIRDQAQLRADVLCPLYGLILGGYDPGTRLLNADGSFEGSPREKYEDTFTVLRDGYGVLRCTNPLVPPRNAS